MAKAVKSIEEYNKKIEKYIKDLETAAVMTVKNPDRTKHWIKTMLDFTQYGYFNQMKIHCAYKNPTYVNTYVAWEKLGVHINQGEHGCKLFRPVIVQGIEKDGKFVSLCKLTQEERDEVAKKHIPIKKHFTGRYSYFTAFDISQTDANEEVLAKLASKKEGPKCESTLKVLQEYTASNSDDIDELSKEVVKDIFEEKEINECPDIEYVMTATQLGLLHYLGEDTEYIHFKEAKTLCDEKYIEMSKVIYEKIKMAIKEITPFMNV